MATTYTDATMGARAIGARTDNAGSAVTDVNAEEDRYAQEMLTQGWLKPLDAFEPVAGAGATMDVIIGSGAAKVDHYVLTGTDAGQGNYIVRHDVTTTTVALNAAHASLARKDEIYLVVQDNAYDGSARALPRFAYRDGTASGSPVAPGPDGAWNAYVLLATIDVPGAAADILATTITDERLPATIEVGDFVGGDATVMLNVIKTVDGAGSGLDADTLDGVEGAGFAPIAHVGSGGSPTQHASAASGVNGFMLGTDKVKMDGIETGATADQTAAQLLTAIKTVDGPGSGLNADLLDNLSGASYAPVSHGTHVATNGIGHDEIVTLYDKKETTSTSNIGTGITPLTSSSFVMPSAGLVRLDWGFQAKNTGASGTGNTITILPRDDGTNVDLYYTATTTLLDGIMPALNDEWYFSGTAFKYFSGANTSVWSLFISKAGPRTFDFTKGFLVVTAIPV